MLHAGFGRPAVRPAAVRCCALQRPSIDLAACPHWLGRLPVAAGATAGAGPALHCSTRASAPVEAPAQPPPPCCPPCSPPCCCPLRRPAASGSASGTDPQIWAACPHWTGPAAQPSCRLHRQRTMPARAALLKSAGCLAKNDRHEPVSMAGRWAPPGAVQAAFAPPAAVCQGRPALWLGLVGAAMTAATSRWRGAALQCSTRACFGSGRGSGSATSDQCPACWSTIRGH
jgi:hypothetical protein